MYQHSQNGTVLRVTLALSFIVLLMVLVWAARLSAQSGTLEQNEQDALMRILAIAFAMLAVLLLFHNLTVSVDPECVRLAFGVGIIAKRIPLKNIVSCAAGKNLWWWGFGIRKIPGGWMWNVSGLQAVEIKLQNGRLFRIGTDEAEVLAGVIKERLASRA